MSSGENPTVAWICALDVELAAATAMLDLTYSTPYSKQMTDVTFTLGRIASHDIVLACTTGQIADKDAFVLPLQLQHIFPTLQFILHVGIGGGVPSRANDVRLGDVVVNLPTASSGGVIKLEMAKSRHDANFVRVGTSDKLAASLLSVIAKLRDAHSLGQTFERFLAPASSSNPRLRDSFARPSPDRDLLFDAGYAHANPTAQDCAMCDRARLAERQLRPKEASVVHYGLIASGDQVVRDGMLRSNIGRTLGVLCLEMEAAGFADTLPTVLVKGICDYADSHKNSGWQGYASAVSAAYAKEFLCTLPSEPLSFDLAANKLSEVKEQRRKIFQWLSPVTFKAQHNGLRASHPADAGSWIFSEPSFRAWLDGSPRLLWCQGVGGTGKTVLASSVIDFLEYRAAGTSSARKIDEPRDHFAFVYCSSIDRARQSPEKIIASLLWQLTEREAEVPQAVNNLYNLHCDIHAIQSTFPSIEELTAVVRELANKYGRTYIVVDALDEVPPEGGARAALLDFLRDMASFSHIFMTSRFIPNMLETFTSFLKIQVVSQSSELSAYLESQLLGDHGLTHFPERYQELLVAKIEQLSADSQANFLTMKLWVDELRYESEGKGLRAFLGHAPGSLSSLYGTLFRQLQLQPLNLRMLALTSISLVFTALRPLTTFELQCALAVRHSRHRLNIDDIPDQEMIFKASRGLLLSEEAASKTSIVRFVHRSAHQYVKKHAAHDLLMARAHRDMLSTCISCLLHIPFVEGPAPNDDLMILRMASNPFWAYAARHWGKHLLILLRQLRSEPISTSNDADTDEELDSRDEEAEKANNLALTFLNCESAVRSATQLTYCPPIQSPEWSQRFPKDITALQLSASFGLSDVCSKLKEQEAGGPIYEEILGRALHDASLNGDPRTVRLLASACHDLDSERGAHGAAIHAAAIGGHKAAVSCLLDYGAKPNNSRSKYGTPLHTAAKSNAFDIVRMLLERGGNPNIANTNGRLPLHEAACAGHSKLLKLLCAQTTDCNAKDADGRTALHLAAFYGHLRTTEVLLHHNARVDEADRYGSTAGDLALQGSHYKIFNVLKEEKKRIDPLVDLQNITSDRFTFSQADIDTLGYETDPEKTDQLTPGAQATSIKVKRRKNSTAYGGHQQHQFIVLKELRVDGESHVAQAKRKVSHREREILAYIRHPNVVQYLKHFDTKEWLRPNFPRRKTFLYTEFCDQGDLQRFVKVEKDSLTESDEPLLQFAEDEMEDATAMRESTSEGSHTSILSVPLTWGIVYGIAAALAFCHHGLMRESSGAHSLNHLWAPIVHRDIKPANIVLSSTADGITIAKLCDLGVAKFWFPDQSRATRTGTERYSPPEIEGPAEQYKPWPHKGDIYSLGKTLEDMNTECEDLDFHNLVRECLAHDPAERPSSFDLLETAHSKLANLFHKTVVDHYYPAPFPTGPEAGGFTFLEQALVQIMNHIFYLCSDSTRPLTSFANRLRLLAGYDRASRHRMLPNLTGHDCPGIPIVFDDREHLLELANTGALRQRGPWNHRGFSLLHVAAREGWEDIVTKIVEEHPEQAERLSSPSQRKTPASWAESRGHVKICTVLARIPRLGSAIDDNGGAKALN